MFATYTVRPQRGIVFGPHVYNTTSAPRSFTIANTGEFDFEYDLSDYGAKEKKEGEEEKVPDKNADPNALVVGQFTVKPFKGTIAPGESETFEVIFAAENDRSYAEILGINVADRDPADSPGGMPYEIMGDSCVPGVNCTDVNSIFEEHRIVQALDPFNPMERVYAMREKAFSFGPTIAVTNKADSGEGDDQGGLVANLKISNTQKVNCTVNFSVSPKMDDPPAEFPITVTPASWEIPPQETRYVTLRCPQRSNLMLVCSRPSWTTVPIRAPSHLPARFMERAHFPRSRSSSRRSSRKMEHSRSASLVCCRAKR